MSTYIKIRSAITTQHLTLPGRIQISFNGEEKRVVIWDNGNLKIVEYCDEQFKAAKKIQVWWRMVQHRNRCREHRAWELQIQRVISERKRGYKGQPIHGIVSGSKSGNVKGSFWISKKNGTVLSKSGPQSKNGDQRWSLGMKGTEYCPTMKIVGIGKHGMKHCVCQCATMIFT